MDYAKDIITESIESLKNINKKLKLEQELIKWYSIINDDIEQLQTILKLEKWDNIYENIKDLKFKTWAQDRKILSELKDNAKAIRDKVKDKIDELKNKIFIYNSKEANSDISAMYENIYEIQNIVLKFSEEYKKAKLQKNII